MNSTYSAQINLQEKLERRIIDGLLKEWDNAILQYLKPDVQKQMKKPFITLREMTSKLAMWSGSKREIIFSREFVMNHPWDSVREVLLHEMAHQFAEEVLGVRDQTSHGPAFRHACLLLRANPEASGSYPTLHERVFSSDLASEDKILLKIRKLMALSESSNTFEAEAAMMKARELIEKYNADLVGSRKKQNYVSLFPGKPALVHTKDEYALSHLLQDFYFVSCIWANAYVLEKGKMGRVLEIHGEIHNVKIAGYVYDFVKHFIDVQWSEYAKNKRLGKRRKTDFAVGVIKGFRSKPVNQEITAPAFSKSKELIKIKDSQLEAYIRYKYPYIRHFRRSGARMDPAVFQDGIDIGKTLVISKGITESSRDGRRLLE